MSKRRAKEKKRTELGATGLILAAIAALVVGTLWSDYRGVPYGIAGGLIWLGALLLFFFLGIFYFAQFVLPMRGSEGLTEGFRLILRHYAAPARQMLMSFGQARSSAPARGKGKEARQQELARKKAADPSLSRLQASFKTLMAGFVRSHQALAIAKGTRYQRSAGPGFRMLFKGEVVTHVVDLRTQVRSEAVAAISRDGIPFKTSASVVFRVEQPVDEPEDEHQPYRYEPEAIFHISRMSSIGAADRLQTWTERLAARAAELLKQQLAEHNLDDLTGDEAAVVLEAIKGTVKRELSSQFRPGVQILGVGIGAFDLPEEVVQQRIKNWQADWQSRIRVKSAQADVLTIRRQNQAQAEAQRQIIESIIRQIEVMRRTANADLAEVITLRMIEAIETATTNEAVRALASRPMLNRLTDTTHQLQGIIKQKDTGETL